MAQMVGNQTVAQGSRAAAPAEKEASVSRSVIFLHSLAFVLGFSVIFTLLGVAAGLLGYGFSIWLQRVGAILLVILALTTLGVFRWLVRLISERIDLETNGAAALSVKVMDFFNNLLYSERRVVEMHSVNRNWGYLSSFVVGMSFGAGWTPCVGPILGSIWFLAGSNETIVQATALMGIYSLGLGIPFLITGAAFGSATKFLRKLNRYSNVVGIFSGILLIAIAYYLWTGELAALAGQFPAFTEMAIELEEWVTATLGFGGDIINASLLASAPIAFIAGIVSFVSPCVLPLVPAYLSYLSGASLSS
ncbi:cytochrome c biogenesis protein CcdA [Chloroflexi bacterium TSY]|nr:cytochrome c biogenesis protein CcdA [Chloroflexi bacterium TSY]